MTDDFKTVMGDQSDEELLLILTTERHKYREDAIKAAELEIEKRGLSNKVVQPIIILQNEQPAETNVYATFEKRFAARLIDCLIVTIIIFSGISFYNLGQSEKNQIEYLEMSGYCFLFFHFIYYPLLDGSGGTYGKRLIKIQPVSNNSFEQITLTTAYKRSFFLIWPMLLLIILSSIFYAFEFQPNLTFYFLSSLIIIFSIVGPAAVGWSKTKQGWHDSWTNTIVINKSLVDDKKA